MSFSALNNFLHLLAAVSWVGGIIYTILVLVPSQTAIDPGQRGKLFGAVVKRFTILVWVSVIVLLLSGIYKIPSLSLFNPASKFDFWLSIKLTAVLVMIINGLMLTFVIAPRLKKLAPPPGEQPSIAFINTQKNLNVIVLSNMILGIIVLFCVSMMLF
jgi:uncharacterized membrane protein